MSVNVADMVKTVPRPLRAQRSWVLYHQAEGKLHAFTPLAQEPWREAVDIESIGCDIDRWERLLTIDDISKYYSKPPGDGQLPDGFGFIAGLTLDITVVKTHSAQDTELISALIPGTPFALKNIDDEGYSFLLYGNYYPFGEGHFVLLDIRDGKLRDEDVHVDRDFLIPFNCVTLNDFHPQALDKVDGVAYNIVEHLAPHRLSIALNNGLQGSDGVVEVDADGNVTLLNGRDHYIDTDSLLNITEAVDSDMPPLLAASSDTLASSAQAPTPNKRPPSFDSAPLDDAKRFLGSYLSSIGLNPSSNKNMHCINPAHQDNTPSMSFDPERQLFYCHGCGVGGTIVDAIKIVEGLNTADAIKRAIDFAGTAPTKPKARAQRPKKKVDLAAIRQMIDNAAGNLHNDRCVEYLAKRGFNDDDRKILSSLRVGFDTIHNDLIIPHGDSYYTARYIFATGKADRFKRNAASPVALFNPDALHNPFFGITEGAFDALSLICCGLPTVALGGAATQRKFLAAVKDAQPRPFVFIAFDNDDAGRKAAEKLSEALTQIGARNRIIIPHSAKDYNDVFINDREKLAAFVSTLPSLIEESPDEHQPSQESPPPPIDLPNHDTTDADIAEQIVNGFAKGKIRYSLDSGKFLVYQPPRWFELPKDADLRTIIRDYRVYLQQSKPPGFGDVIGNLTSEKKIAKVVTHCHSYKELWIRHDDLNPDDMLLNCKNGVVDLRTGEMIGHSPSHLITQLADVDFDPTATSDVFDRFLETTISNADTRLALQIFLGYCITGVINEEKALFVVGSGGNGKGTLFRSVLAMLGDYGTPFKIDAVLAAHRTQDANAASPEFNKLEFRRLAIAEEMPARRQLDAAQFKLLTGGDYLPIRKLHQEARTIKHVTHKLILSGNVLPELSNADDEGLKRRLLVLQFKNSFGEAERDTKLKQKLSTPKARSAILNWLLDGCRQWQERGLITSTEMNRDRELYLVSQDHLGDFISEHCIVGETHQCYRKDFMTAVRQHGDYEARNMSDKEITNYLLTRTNVTIRRNNRGRFFVGIALLDNERE